MSPCPVCLSEGPAPIVREVNGYTLRHCSLCDLVYADPMRSPGPEWYETHTEYFKTLLLGLDFLGWNHRQFLRDLPHRGGRLLDIGCGSGRFLAHAAIRGYAVTGCDFNPVAVQIARTRYGLTDVHCASVAELRRRMPERRFDVITAFEVLEHMDDPAGLLTAIAGWLESGGVVALSVPYRDRWPRFGVNSAWDLPPHHLTWWSERAIEEALRRVGLQVQTIRTGWMIGEEVWMKYVRLHVIDRLFRGATRGGAFPSAALTLAPFASRALRVKRLMSRVGAAPINMVLRLLGATGMDMYALAKRP